MKYIGFLKEEINKYQLHGNVLIAIYNKSQLQGYLSQKTSILSVYYYPEILITTQSLKKLSVSDRDIEDPARGKGSGYIIKNKNGEYFSNELLVLFQKNGSMIYKNPKQSENGREYSIKEAIIELMRPPQNSKTNKFT